MSVSRSYVRNLVFLALISIIGILATQYYWANKALELQDSQFNHSVNVALDNIVKKLLSTTGNGVELEFKNRVKKNYYTLDFTQPVKLQNLEEYIFTEFNNQGLKEPFEYAVFDCTKDSLIYGKYVAIIDISKVEKLKIRPKYDQNYYIGIFFPNKKNKLVSDWTIFTLLVSLLILIMAFFGYAINLLLKQKKVSEIKNDFVNNMTHELKTPISTIGLAADVLMNEELSHKPDKLRHYAKIIFEENNRLKKQVQAVLQVATMDSKKPVLKYDVIDLVELLNTLVASMEMRVQEKSGTLLFENTAKEHVIFGDSVHITNVFYNLVDNAIKYCDKTPHLKILVHNKRKGIEVQIIDNGKGIPKEDIDNIFEKFYRVHSGNIHDVKGFGLGLFYVKTIITEHKGKIFAKSKVGEGSIFYIWLPFKR
jgi:two-component system phosphate regulon sensor histidine kinase PhoR